MREGRCALLYTVLGVSVMLKSQGHHDWSDDRAAHLHSPVNQAAHTHTRTLIHMHTQCIHVPTYIPTNTHRHRHTPAHEELVEMCTSVAVADTFAP